MYFLNTPVFCFIFLFFDGWFMELSGWYKMYSNRKTSHRLSWSFGLFESARHIFHHTEDRTRCAQRTRWTVSQQICWPFLIWVTCVHPLFRDLEPVCYYSGSQTRPFGDHSSESEDTSCLLTIFHPGEQNSVSVYHNRMLLRLLSRVIKCTSQQYWSYRLQSVQHYLPLR